MNNIRWLIIIKFGIFYSTIIDISISCFYFVDDLSYGIWATVGF